jgi:hypothetical protein
MPEALLTWWLALCVASVFNVGAWTLSARMLHRRMPDFPPAVYATRRLLLMLSAVYVLGCAFRSFLPMIDVPRMCLHDTWVSRIVVGRSVATVAELCFVAQWALLMREAGAATNSRLAKMVSGALVPLIVIAEGASWFAVLSTNNLFHALENSLWTVAAALAMAACVSLRFHVDDKSRRFLDAAIGCGALYVLFMVTVDVPMYLSRWLADAAAGHERLAVLSGLHEVVQRCVVVRDWTHWRQDVPWLSLYFTAAVWISIALPHVPAFRSAGDRRCPQAGTSSAVQPE